MHFIIESLCIRPKRGLNGEERGTDGFGSNIETFLLNQGQVGTMEYYQATVLFFNHTAVCHLHHFCCNIEKRGFYFQLLEEVSKLCISFKTKLPLTNPVETMRLVLLSCRKVNKVKPLVEVIHFQVRKI